MSAIAEALSRLAGEGLMVPGDAAARLDSHVQLVREWNRVVSLVSKPDLAELETRHVVDSLSLAPLLVSRGWSGELLLDVGSGAGFPVVPLAIVMPELRVILVERSERKVGFLRKVVGALGLEKVRIVCGEFPKVAEDFRPGVITARAVERPASILGAMAGYLEKGAVFLCQAGDPRDLVPEMFHVEPSGPRFHVEHWEDDWSRDGLRRGTLYLISRAETTPSSP
ncbi:MAG: hypothetical protein AMXMBFR82_08890 [Candidatus Hydrogenedentota bacterium]